jgi:hypothetical protein
MQDSATAGTPGWRGLAIVAANPRGAIYGTIVATALIAATAAGGKSPELILAATVATLLVFWLAHVYADVLDHGLRHGRADLKVLGSIMVQELSMLAAPAPSILFLLLGAVGLFGERLAVLLALWNGVVQLVGWGIDVGRRRGQAWPAALLTGLINGAFGLVIVCWRCCCTDGTAPEVLPSPQGERAMRNPTSSIWKLGWLRCRTEARQLQGSSNHPPPRSTRKVP